MGRRCLTLLYKLTGAVISELWLKDKAHAFELRVVHAYNYGTFFKNYTQ